MAERKIIGCDEALIDCAFVEKRLEGSLKYVNVLLIYEMCDWK
jgi:hypothetical protein